MRVNGDIEVAAPIDLVWSIVTDPERVLSFMSGVTRWEVAGSEPTGLGARYQTLLRVGAAEVGGLIEVVECLPPIDLREEFGPEPDLDAVYEEVVARMQAALDALASERRLPIVG